MAKDKILIDCDPGHDDAVAILFAARHLDLVGITTVHGNNTLANTTRNGLAVLEFLHGDVDLVIVNIMGLQGRPPAAQGKPAAPPQPPVSHK